MPASPSLTKTNAPIRVALVVDDFSSVRYYHSYILKRAGFICEAANNGEEAVQKLEHVAVDLAVIDIMMPKLNGWELIQHIRANPRYSRLPILVISSEPAAPDLQKITGPIGFAKKPLAPDSVLEEISRLLRSSFGGASR
ncbi:MAG: response regulator [Nibricoccus sp.]